MSAKKFDEDKLPMDLLDPEWLEGIASVLRYGAKKYAAHNWRKGLSYSRLYAAAQRHLTQFAKGWEYDEETDESHLLHASCCLMFLYHMQQNRPDMNDMFWADAPQTPQPADDNTAEHRLKQAIDTLEHLTRKAQEPS